MYLFSPLLKKNFKQILREKKNHRKSSFLRIYRKKKSVPLIDRSPFFFTASHIPFTPSSAEEFSLVDVRYLEATTGNLFQFPLNFEAGFLFCSGARDSVAPSGRLD